MHTCIIQVLTSLASPSVAVVTRSTPTCVNQFMYMYMYTV